MTRTTLGILAVLLVGVFVAVRLGGTEGMGVVAGVLCGASVAARSESSSAGPSASA